MKTYLLTSPNFTGEVEFVFDDSGRLQDYRNRAELNSGQKKWLLEKLPKTLSELSNVLADSKTAKLTEVVVEITFEMFWHKYNDKVNSSRKKTQQKWDRMTKAEQVKAYRYIGYYFSTLPQGTRKKYAETYLNAELWNN